ncbi:MAG: aldo/keto reductase [Pseudomonadaceae bacterium]|nr:aldo/keto reductase [Pseudomonadaceae bacterium]
MSQPIRWGILATGNIANVFARAITASTSGVVAAAASRQHNDAQAFAERFDGCRAVTGYQALIDDADIDAIYVSTPHPMHAEWTIAALNTGKAVLCEKPMGVSYGETMAMVHAARSNNAFLMEAFMYRCHPQTLKACELINDGAIGEVRHITANFGFNAPFNPTGRLFASELAGGGIMDVGCYPVSIARLIMADEPEEISVQGSFTDSGVDAYSHALLKFSGGRSASLGTAVQLNLDNTVRIDGSRGHIVLDMPWHPGKGGTDWAFELHIDGEGAQSVTGTSEPLYVIEADEVARCVREGRIESDHMSHADSLGNATVLDRWRSAMGLEFTCEATARTVAPLPSVAAAGNRIPRSPMHGMDKPIARLVMGCDNQPNMRHAAVMWDHYWQQGGNAFDTAHIYGGGSMESLLGEWQANRCVREEMVIIGKGAHTPDNFPQKIGPQLTQSLERLQTDYVDVYFLHRDNTDLPVGEFIDALNDEVKAGRIRSFGGSNWTEARVREANEYASKNGLVGFSAISNNFSLARMINRIWPGVEAASDDSYRTYLEGSQLALLPWSSQARGFFTDWAADVIAGHDTENMVATAVEPSVAELKRTWFSDDNLERRNRAEQLAGEKGVSLITIALAYVLAQKFPTFALVGPRTLTEIDSCIEALNCSISSEQVDWLDLR